MASSSKRSMVASKMPHNLTSDDKKVLGPQLTARQEKTALPSQYKTMKFRTQRSSWTPVVHRPSNEQVRAVEPFELPCPSYASSGPSRHKTLNQFGLILVSAGKVPEGH